MSDIDEQLLFELVGGDGVAALFGEPRADAIKHCLLNTWLLNLKLHEQFAMSGAMRWPLSMRPEVLIATSVNAI